MPDAHVRAAEAETRVRSADGGPRRLHILLVDDDAEAAAAP
jgi:hypothetical protein